MSKRKGAAQMWFPRKDMMGKLQMATVEKLQPLRDTWMAAEGALVQAGHDYLQDNEVVVQKNANNKFRIGLWGGGLFFFLVLVWELLSAWPCSCHLCRQAPETHLGQAEQDKQIPPHLTVVHCTEYFCTQVQQQGLRGWLEGAQNCCSVSLPPGEA